eukprot:Amastigsp_a512176_8.p4 type:complete len:136 gc:universal Amastigsp_a512176_8:656-249(-)
MERMRSPQLCSFRVLALGSPWARAVLLLRALSRKVNSQLRLLRAAHSGRAPEEALRGAPGRSNRSVQTHATASSNNSGGSSASPSACSLTRGTRATKRRVRTRARSRGSVSPTCTSRSHRVVKRQRSVSPVTWMS